MNTQKALAAKNIRLYVVLKIFFKRVFLPLSAIYFVQVDHFTLKEIGLLGGFFSLVQLIAELPTGYFSDRLARVTSIRIGAALNIAATLLYVFVHQKSGVFLASGLEALGYSFFSGAGEALIHDSLVVTKQEQNYSKIIGRAQSISLIINAGLLALVPLTYRIDPRLPFLIGTVAYTILLVTAFMMTDVTRTRAVATRKRLSFKLIVKSHHIIAFGILFGIVSALFTGPSDIFNLTLKSFGIKPELLGILFSAASLFAAILGPFIYLLKRLSVIQYMLLDLSMAVVPLLAAFAHSAVILSVAFLLSISFWRYRKIIYQEHLLRLYPTGYKATLLSGMSFVEEIALLWIPISVATVASQVGLGVGLGLTGIAGIVVAPFYIASARRLFRPALKN
jgi:MFS family permease